MNKRPADRLVIALAQLNPVVGDVAGNARKIREARARAAGEDAELVLFPELFLAVAGLALLVLGVFNGDKAAARLAGW